MAIGGIAINTLELLDCFGPHCVALSVWARAPSGERTDYVYTGSVVESRGQWIWLTAGHVFTDDLDTALAAGYEILSAGLWDYINSKGVTRQPLIPIVFENLAHRSYSFDGVNLAIMEIPNDARRLMEANGVKVTSMREVGHWQADYRGFALIGIPEETVRPVVENGIARMEAGLVVLPLSRRQDVEFSNGLEMLSFWADMSKVQIGSQPLRSVKGMSGGLVFGFSQTKEDTYNSIGVQSSWNPNTHVLRATPLLPLIELLENGVKADGSDAAKNL